MWRQSSGDPGNQTRREVEGRARDETVGEAQYVIATPYRSMRAVSMCDARLIGFF